MRFWASVGVTLFALILTDSLVAAHEVDPPLLVFAEVGQTLGFSVSDCCTCQASIQAFSNDVQVCAVNSPQSGAGISVDFTVDATGVGSTTISVSWQGFGTDDDGFPCVEDDTVELEVIVLPPRESSGNTTDTPSVSDPVNPYAGEFYLEEEPDVDLGGPLPLRFQRYYGSSLFRENFGDRELGQGWLHTYDFQMFRGFNFFDPEQFVLVVTNRGRILRFEKIGSTWELQDNADIPWQLVEDFNDLLLGDPLNQVIYRFDSNGSLREVFDANGNTLTLTYSFHILGFPVLTSVSDGLGRTISIGHDVNAKISSVSDGTRSRAYTVTNGELVSYTDAEDNETTYAYDSSDAAFGALMTSKTMPRGNIPFTNAYDASGRVQSQTDGENNTWLFSYNASDTVVTDPEGRTATYGFDGDGQLTSFANAVAGQVNYGYDSAGRLATLAATGSGAQDLTYQFEYHAPSGNVSRIVYPDGEETTFAYEARSTLGVNLYYPTLISNPNGTTDSFSYDSAGNLTSQTGRLDDTWTFTYDGQGNVTSATLPTTSTYTFTYNGDGTLATLVDAQTNTTTYGYDTFRRIGSVTHPDTTSFSITYDDNDNPLTFTNEANVLSQIAYNANRMLASTTDGRNNTTTYAYDELDRLVGVTAPNGSTASRVFDSLGRLSSITDRSGNTSSVGFDAVSGLVTSRTDGENNTWSRTFDDNGFITSMTDPLDFVTNYQTNYLGQVTQATSPKGAVWQMDFDVFDQLDAITDPLGQIMDFGYSPHWWLDTIDTLGGSIATTYSRSKLGLVEATIDSLSQAWTTAHDAQGRLITATDPLGNSTTFAYNNRNRIQTVTYPDSLGVQTVTYTPTGQVSERDYDDGTNLTYTYDNDGSLTASNNLTLTPDMQGQTVESNGLTLTRDGGDQILTITYGPGMVVTYTYDGRGLPITVTDWEGGVTTLGYDAMGRMTSISRPNGMTTTYTYNKDGAISSVRDRDNSNALISKLTLTRDLRGQLTAATRDVPLAGVPADEIAAMTFDNASQVSAFTYDALGRLADDGDRVYDWDLAGRLTGHDDGISAVTYTYDGIGKVVSRTEGGTTYSYIWNYGIPMPVVSTVQIDGTDSAYYIYTPFGQLLHRINASNGNRRFYHFDEIGNTMYLTNDSGTVTDTYALSPYGRVLAETGTTDHPFVYGGQAGVMRDGDSNLYYMRARYYDADTARFLSRDPFNRSISPLETNPYSYARANPMLYHDPLGFNARVIYDGSIHTDIAVDIWCGDQIIGTLKLGFFLTSYVQGKMNAIDSIGALGYGAPSTIKGQMNYGSSLGNPGRSGNNLTINGSKEQDERLARQLLEWLGIGGIGDGMSPGDVIKASFPLPKGKDRGVVRVSANSTSTYGAYRTIGFSRVCNDFTDDALDVYYGEDWRSWWALSNRYAGEMFDELVRYEHLRNSTNGNWLSYPQNEGK